MRPGQPGAPLPSAEASKTIYLQKLSLLSGCAASSPPVHEYMARLDFRSLRPASAYPASPVHRRPQASLQILRLHPCRPPPAPALLAPPAHQYPLETSQVPPPAPAFPQAPDRRSPREPYRAPRPNPALHTPPVHRYPRETSQAPRPNPIYPAKADRPDRRSGQCRLGDRQTIRPTPPLRVPPPPQI